MPDSQMPDPQAQIDAVFTPPSPSAPTPTPAVETPVVETPAVATPVVETPVAEVPKVEAPVDQAPVVASVPELESSRVETPNIVKVNDDTPLAFVGASIEPSVSNVSPATIPPLVEKPKAKRRIGLLLLILFFLVGSGGSGYWYYQKYAAPGSINITSDKRELEKIITGTVRTQPGQSVTDAKLDAIEKETGSRPATIKEATQDLKASIKDEVESVYSPGVYNARQEREVDAGDGGSNPTPEEQCAATGGTYYNGACVPDKSCTGGASCPIDCGSGFIKNPNGKLVQEAGKNYCNAQGQYCQVTRIEWRNPNNKHCFLTQNEDCSGSCDERESRTTTTTEEPEALVMACTSITRAPTTVPTIGSTPVFTCLGTVTPADAGTLSYKFRYKKDSGAYIALTNKTPTTAELAITACGTYSVECQACATLEGVLTCDPIWTGATQ